MFYYSDFKFISFKNFITRLSIDEAYFDHSLIFAVFVCISLHLLLAAIPGRPGNHKV